MKWSNLSTVYWNLQPNMKRFQCKSEIIELYYTTLEVKQKKILKQDSFLRIRTFFTCCFYLFLTLHEIISIGNFRRQNEQEKNLTDLKI